MKYHGRHGPNHTEEAQASMNSSFLAGQCSTEEECLLWELQSEKVFAGSKGHSEKPSTGDAREEWKGRCVWSVAGLRNTGWREEGDRASELEKLVCAQVYRLLLGHKGKVFFLCPLLRNSYWKRSGPETAGSGLSCDDVLIILPVSWKGTLSFPVKVDRAGTTLTVALLIRKHNQSC